MENKINRVLLSYKKNINKPYRTKTGDLIRFIELIKIKENRNDFFKLLDGINPNTNRKIKIEGKTYKNLKEQFFFKMCENIKYIIFENLDHQNLNTIDIIKNYDKYLYLIDEYIEETEKIFNPIDKKNKKINKHNEKIFKLNQTIENFKDWEQYIIYKGLKYGQPKIVKNYFKDREIEKIHLFENCKGKLNLISEESILIKEGNCRPFYTEPDTYEKIKYFCCNKCGFKYIEKEQY